MVAIRCQRLESRGVLVFPLKVGNGVLRCIRLLIDAWILPRPGSAQYLLTVLGVRQPGKSRPIPRQNPSLFIGSLRIRAQSRIFLGLLGFQRGSYAIAPSEEFILFVTKGPLSSRRSNGPFNSALYGIRDYSFDAFDEGSESD